MKKLLLILCSALLLVSCAKAPAKDDLPDNQTEDFSGITLNLYDKTAILREHNGENIIAGGFFDYADLSDIAGFEVDVKPYDENIQLTKILAGDKDIDIYLVDIRQAEMLVELGACEPIKSDKVKDFNSKCFDSLQRICVNDSGETVLMPVSFAIDGLFVPKDAVDELGITSEDVRYLYDYLDYIKAYKGERISYLTPPTELFNRIEEQYACYYCNYSEGEFDFTTDTFKKLYTTLLGDWCAQEGESPWYGLHDISGKISHPTYSWSTDKSLFVIDDFGVATELQNYYTDWVAFPVPRLDETVGKTPANGWFLYINPNSENKQAAEKLLEVIADNFYKLRGKDKSSNLLFKDVTMYPKDVEVESDIFKQYLEIAEETTLFFSLTNITRDDITGYQNGSMTLDEALAERTRVVDYALNE